MSKTALEIAIESLESIRDYSADKGSSIAAKEALNLIKQKQQEEGEIKCFG